jgi:hypothetical protein
MIEKTHPEPHPMQVTNKITSKTQRNLLYMLSSTPSSSIPSPLQIPLKNHFRNPKEVQTLVPK